MADSTTPADDPIADLAIQELAASGFALAVQLIRDRDEAADAVQDALHRLLRQRDVVDRRRGSPRAWFLKVVRNRCLDLLRKRSRRRAASLAAHEPVAAAAERPDLVAEQQELLELLKTELLGMPPQQRELILLRDFHNLAYAEMAQVLSVPVGTIMSRLHRARSELRQRMQRYR